MHEGFEIFCKINPSIKIRAKEIESDGIKPMDSLHISCAEAAGCDYFVTCDDRIIKRYKGNIDILNPVNFIFLMTSERGDENGTGE